MTAGTPDRVYGPRWRARLVRIFFAVVVVGQAVLVLRSYDDPHNFFGFQPFNESSTWEAEIVAVQPDGTEIDLRDGWYGYDWNELVHISALQHPWRQRHAYSGIGTTLDFLDEALDWIAANTPRDTTTAYLEARVTYFRNTEGPHRTVLRSEVRG